MYQNELQLHRFCLLLNVDYFQRIYIYFLLEKTQLKQHLNCEFRISIRSTCKVQVIRIKLTTISKISNKSQMLIFPSLPVHYRAMSKKFGCKSVDYNANWLNVKRRVKSHLPSAGIIRSSPYSPRQQDKGQNVVQVGSGGTSGMITNDSQTF